MMTRTAKRKTKRKTNNSMRVAPLNRLLRGEERRDPAGTRTSEGEPELADTSEEEPGLADTREEGPELVATRARGDEPELADTRAREGEPERVATENVDDDVLTGGYVEI
jgi:hypothetical protein